MSESKRDVWSELGDEIGNFLLQSFREEANKPNSSFEMVEILAAYAHDQQWSGWMSYLFSKCEENADGSATIPASWYWRWKYQMSTPYSELPEDMKESDREEARGMLRVMGPEG